MTIAKAMPLFLVLCISVGCVTNGKPSIDCSAPVMRFSWGPCVKGMQLGLAVGKPIAYSDEDLDVYMAYRNVSGAPISVGEMASSLVQGEAGRGRAVMDGWGMLDYSRKDASAPYIIIPPGCIFVQHAVLATRRPIPGEDDWRFYVWEIAVEKCNFLDDSPENKKVPKPGEQMSWCGGPIKSGVVRIPVYRRLPSETKVDCHDKTGRVNTVEDSKLGATGGARAEEELW